MSCAKIPFIFLATLGLQITVTPPHPPPSSSEKAPSTGLEFIVQQRLGPLLVKIICWLGAIAETTVIVTRSVPENDLSRSVLSALVITGSADQIRITPHFLLGIFLTTLGGYIRYRCYKELGRLFTFEMSIREGHELIRTGPYAIVRHPGYSGVICAILGIVLWHASSGSWTRTCGALEITSCRLLALTFLTLVTIIVVGLLRRMPKEDEALKKEFPEEWADWAEKVPCRLLPGVY
ncbi:uncharacterized protein BT62DRAFT_116091 [Guyanagaster necrorhizus]|uniref:Protein-S-isoprenylcysteine O-methyltransferase n=1 Tax=Guyanagaster necrorhizus TaxID=856835 RepID=A0A9P7VS31_9AGAR|nr:uncharacterized protein BT62DRAFT_116091 [Guyanagaster necrorhizus MCA 3950]KAG7446398.1 hypothetical protein BT62DRAFT_116091 [Guyanagaster necrorhizus MCA 3950]